MIFVVVLMLTGCENPGGMSDENYAEYKELGAPKILYTCQQEEQLAVNFEALKKCSEIKDDRSREMDCIKNASRTVKPPAGVGYVAGLGPSQPYNKLLSDLKEECKGQLKIIHSKR
jgi:hypothetical protein